MDDNKKIRFEHFKSNISKLCKKNNLDFITVLKIVGFTDCANVISEACDYYERHDFISAILLEDKGVK